MAIKTSNPNTFYLPDLGEGLQEAEIIAWHVAAGDHVVADQPLVSVETDKAVVDIPSPHSGHIARLLVEPGARLRVGDPLVEFEHGVHADSGTVVGHLATSPPAAPAPQAQPPTTRPGQIKAAPAVRALAKQRHVDLMQVAGTGPQGAITSADVERAATLAAVPAGEPLRGVRRAMAERMAQAHHEVVPATVSDDADVEHWYPDGRSVMLRLIRAMIAGCKAAPALNAWFDGKMLSRQLHTRIDLGIAVNTEDGLFVPVLRDVGNRSSADLHQGLERLRADVAARHMPPQELRGQTITLSNFGAIGGKYAAMVVVPPQVAIFGAGRIAPRIVPVDGQPAVHNILPLSLTIDHRAVTGDEATRFLTAAIADLEQPD
jgi:pyruvate dehydrogenase E2 component (dihydrolipoamide acetyltransferase)